MNKHQKILEAQLAENYEPDCEDFYLAEIESKASDYNKLQEENIALRKGLNKVLLKRKKWKSRYYFERIKNKQLKIIILKLIGEEYLSNEEDLIVENIILKGLI